MDQNQYEFLRNLLNAEFKVKRGMKLKPLHSASDGAEAALKWFPNMNQMPRGFDK